MISATLKVCGIGNGGGLTGPETAVAVPTRGLGGPRRLLGTPGGRAELSTGHPALARLRLPAWLGAWPSAPDCSRPSWSGPRLGSGRAANRPPSSSSQRLPLRVCGSASSPLGWHGASCERQWPSVSSSGPIGASPAAPGYPAHSPGVVAAVGPQRAGAVTSFPELRERIPLGRAGGLANRDQQQAVAVLHQGMAQER